MKKHGRLIKVLFFIVLTFALIAMIKPSDNGKSYDPYFKVLNDELKNNGTGRPMLLIDLDRLDDNLGVVMSHIGEPSFRLVVKSLPSLLLIKYIMKRTGTNKLMVFHQPHINLLAESGMKNIDILIGKPMPVNAVKSFFKESGKSPGFNPAEQIQWLIDTPERALQYLEFAKKKKIMVKMNIEIDVGLHRGGVEDNHSLDEILKIISENGRFVKFSGFMGYEPHLASVPALFTDKKDAIREASLDVIETYKNFVDYGKDKYPELFKGNLTFNSGGSKTYKLYSDQGLINDVSLGSGIVKATDFDSALLTDHRPAFFIATPVLKKIKGTKIPFIESVSGIFSLWNPNRDVTYFVYSGGWLAETVSPEGLLDNSFFGFSTNQSILNGSEKTGADVDDHVFFRPTQSEKVMLQFGNILVIRGGRIIDEWPAFRK